MVITEGVVEVEVSSYIIKRSVLSGLRAEGIVKGALTEIHKIRYQSNLSQESGCCVTTENQSVRSDIWISVKTGESLVSSVVMV